jgi:uncharacterized protein
MTATAPALRRATDPRWSGSRRAVRAWTSPCIVALLAAGCRGAPPAPVPARGGVEPAGYREALREERARKDLFFKEGPESPLPESRKGTFTGLEYYPIDPVYRFEGEVALYPNPPRLTIAGTRGEQRVAERWGVFSFELEGSVHTLQIYRLFEPDDPDGILFLPFSDETTGRETYPAGRYVDPKIRDGVHAVVDFNRAYSPYCAYGKSYDCPICPAENRLDIPIAAGERGRRGG